MPVCSTCFWSEKLIGQVKFRDYHHFSRRPTKSHVYQFSLKNRTQLFDLNDLIVSNQFIHYPATEKNTTHAIFQYGHHIPIVQTIQIYILCCNADRQRSGTIVLSVVATLSITYLCNVLTTSFKPYKSTLQQHRKTTLWQRFVERCVNVLQYVFMQTLL